MRPFQSNQLKFFGVLLLVWLLGGSHFSFDRSAKKSRSEQKKTVSPIGLAVRVDSRQSITTPQKKSEFGLLDFPDCPPGLLRYENTLYLFGGNNRAIIRMTGNSIENLKPSPSDENGKAVPVLEPSGRPGDFDGDYVGGGPVYYDSDSDQLLLFYHGEYHQSPWSGEAYYSAIGMAVSADLGETFERLGEIIRPNASRNKGSKEPVEVSNASFIAKDGFFYVYYSDCYTPGVTSIAVARADVKEVVAQAKNRKTASWKKYLDGRFSEPGIGGKFTPVVPTPEGKMELWKSWPFVAYNSALGKYIMVHQQGWSGIYLRTSEDGFKWDPEGTKLVSVKERGDKMEDTTWYPFVIGTGSAPSTIGREFWLYYTFYPGDSERKGNFEKGHWVRVKVTLETTQPRKRAR